ncbi:hypothetical protein DIKCMJMK_00906 [Shewanella oneidensis]|nr:hypothetical protein [Shewanella oneidensis]
MVLFDMSFVKNERNDSATVARTILVVFAAMAEFYIELIISTSPGQ